MVLAAVPPTRPTMSPATLSKTSPPWQARPRGVASYCISPMAKGRTNADRAMPALALDGGSNAIATPNGTNRIRLSVVSSSCRYSTHGAGPARLRSHAGDPGGSSGSGSARPGVSVTARIVPRLATSSQATPREQPRRSPTGPAKKRASATVIAVAGTNPGYDEKSTPTPRLLKTGVPCRGSPTGR